MEIQSMEKNRDNTSCIDYQGQSIVECDLKMQSSATETDVNCFESAEHMMQTEELFKQKEREVEQWEEKYNKINAELTALKVKVLKEHQNSFEVSLICCHVDGILVSANNNFKKMSQFHIIGPAKLILFFWAGDKYCYLQCKV